MIVIKLMGGLGNQLFQYAAARSLSLDKKTKLYLDRSLLDNEATEAITYRHYELNSFNIKSSKATKSQLFGFKLATKYPAFQSLLPFSTICEPHFEFTSTLSVQQKNLYLKGYWQSEKYFSKNEKQIRDDLQFVKPLTGLNKEVAEQIKNCNAVAVHIRRGDYVTNAQINSNHGTCSFAYYQQAITTLKAKFQNLNFYFFSDDIDWTKQNFNSLENSFFISHNKNENSFYDMQLMSFCNHFVIANSSFSWWAAWLAQHKNKTVIAPAKWFNTETHNTKDLLPESWIKL